MHPNTEVLEIRGEKDGAAVTARILATGDTSVEVYDLVILCTGFDDCSVFETAMIGDELKRRISTNENPCGYAIAWDGPQRPQDIPSIAEQKKPRHRRCEFYFCTRQERVDLEFDSGKEIYKIDGDDKLVSL